MLELIIGLTLGLGILLILSSGQKQKPKSKKPAGFAVKLSLLLNEAGITKVPAWLAILCALASALLLFAVFQLWFRIPALSLVAAITGVILPVFILKQLANSRRAQARNYWPQALELLISAIRAGQSLPAALAELAELNLDQNNGFDEFRRSYERGSSFSGALDRLKKKLADPTADRILESLRVAREVGGTELVPILLNLSEDLRSQNQLRGELVARQSWLINSARLAVAAPWLVLLLLGSRAETAEIYSTPVGSLIILLGFVVSVVAYYLMLSMAKFSEEERWLI